jgi:hypothetical protein
MICRRLATSLRWVWQNSAQADATPPPHRRVGAHICGGLPLVCSKAAYKVSMTCSVLHVMNCQSVTVLIALSNCNCSFITRALVYYSLLCYFLQVVWKGTSKLGCGMAYCSNLNARLYTCRYSPPGVSFRVGGLFVLMFLATMLAGLWHPHHRAPLLAGITVTMSCSSLL